MKKRLVLTTTLVVIAITLVATALIPSTVSAAGLYSKTITVNSSQVPSTQTNFPVLISLVNDSDLAAHVARADGGDIYFTDSGNTTQYSHEIESYNNTTGTLVAWVKVPILSSSANTDIKMWYGVDSGTPQWDPTNVWDSNFKGVWHMAQVNVSDSTSNGNNGTVVNSTVASSLGLIDGADSFNNSYYSYIDCGNSSSLSFNASAAYTWSAWVNTTGTTGGGGGIIGKAKRNVSGYDTYLRNGNGITIENGIGGGSAPKVQGSTFSSNTWKQVTITYNNQSVSIYLNGSLDTSGALSGMINDSSSHIFIGFRASRTNGTGIFNGSIDEVRYSTEVRSTDWIRTEYNNQNNPSNFYSVSGETGAPTPSPTPTVSPTVSPTMTCPCPTLTPSPTVSPTASPTPTTSPTVVPTSTSTPTPTAAGGPGDVNDDGHINCCDITQCELCILYPGIYPKENYPGWDANEDNEGPNAGDILAVEMRILGTWSP